MMTQPHGAAPSTIVTLKQLLRTLALSVALIVNASLIHAQSGGSAAANQPEGQEIGDRWTSSPEYQEYLKLGGEKSAEARAIKVKVIAEITRQVLQPYIDSFDAKYKEMMDKKINELPLQLRILLGIIYQKIKYKTNPDHSPTEINMLNTFIYQYIKAINDSNGSCITNVDKITSKFPELAGTNIEKFLRDVGTSNDTIAKSEANIAKSEANIAKLEANIAAWDLIIKKLKKIQ